VGEPTRVLIVDDHKVVRKGLHTIMALNDAVELVGEAANGEEAIEQTALLRPDVVVMDMKMPVMDGPTAIERIRSRFPDVNVVALTSFDEPSLARRALEAGAVGYLYKDVDEEVLVAAIRMAAEGRGVIAPDAMQAIVHGTADDYEVALTGREHEVLLMLARGLTNPQIADELMISVSTINFHVHNLLDKLGAKTRTEAVSIAAREGLIEL
jgi:NarL family two-component system response regulator LiaR